MVAICRLRVAGDQSGQRAPRAAGSQIYVYDIGCYIALTGYQVMSCMVFASDGSCYTPSISQDGRFVVFESLATNLDAAS